ncbi:MAG TPA: glycosyltransferase, partial [Aeromicrobium sp.]|nr:glycosyltransferase [Aeromicrobium sp.]
EIWVLLNGHDPLSAGECRAQFAERLPPERIVMFFPPDALELQIARDRPRRTAAELTRAHLIRSVAPDCLIITSLIEPPGSESVTTNNDAELDAITAAVLYDLIPWLNSDIYLADADLRQYYEAKLEEIKKARLLLAISESARQEAIDHLGTAPADVVNVSAAARDDFAPPAGPVELSPALGVNRRFIMYAPSGYDPRKNLVGLIQAFAQLPADVRGDFQLVITSKFADHDHERLRIAARKAGLAGDELVLTGYVSDADLIALYQATDLFVYPSVHEGFGLPALEAMACGAPVIGSDRTSIPEIIGLESALFDPTSVPQMTSRIGETLADEGARAKLRAHGSSQARKFSWAHTAGSALDAIEAAFGPARDASSRTDTTRTGPPRMALVTPMPPQETGIAFYAAALLPELAKRFELTLVCDQPVVDLPPDAGPIARRDPAWLRAHADEFDHVVYQFGNSVFHMFMVPLLRAVPGTVVLHDFFLSGLYRAGQATGALPEGLSRAVRDAHGDVAWRMESLDELEQNYPANRSILNDATGVIVHSRHAKELIERWYGAPARPFDGLKIGLVPLARSGPGDLTRAAARSALGIGDDTFLVGSFGRVHPTKCDAELVRAWLDSQAATNPRSELHLVGAGPDDAYAKRLRSLVGKHPHGKRVKLVGWVSPDTYLTYLQATDLAVQLRTSSRGETSAAVLDCLAHGIPTIVNEHGSAAELPDSTVRRVPDTFSVTDVTRAIDELAGDVALRDRLGDAARAHIELHHSAAHCADEYEAFLADVARDRRRHHTTLVRSVASSPAGSRPEVLTDVAQALARSVRLPVTAPQLLIDVTGMPAWPDLDVADALVLARQSPTRVQFVHIEASPRGPRFRLLDGHPRPPAQPGEPRPLADIRQGDVILMAAPANAGDPTCQSAYRDALAAGARLAVPTDSSAALVEVVGLLGPADVGLFCNSDELFDIATRAARSRGIPVTRVDGPDVRLSAMASVLAVP